MGGAVEQTSAGERPSASEGAANTACVAGERNERPAWPGNAMNSAIGLWVAAEWRRRWPALLGIAVLVALAGGAATALAAGARRADTAYTAVPRGDR